jgi:hypothetical protein
LAIFDAPCIFLFHIQLLRCKPGFLLPGGRWRASSDLRGTPKSPEDTCQRLDFFDKPARLTAGLDNCLRIACLSLVGFVVFLQPFS